MRKEKYIYLAGIIIGLVIFLTSFFPNEIFADATTPIVQASSTAYVDGTVINYSIILPTLEANEVIFLFTRNINPVLESFWKFTINGVDAIAGGGGAISEGETNYWSYFVATSSGQYNIATSWEGPATGQWSTAIAVSGVDTVNPVSASSSKGYASTATSGNWQVNGTINELLLNELLNIGDREITSMGAGQTMFFAWKNADLRIARGVSMTATTTGENSMSYVLSGAANFYGTILSVKKAVSAATIKSIISDWLWFE